MATKKESDRLKAERAASLAQKNKISASPLSTIRHYVKKYDMSVEQAIDELNKLGFQCNADDEITSSILTKLIEIRRTMLEMKRKRLVDQQTMIRAQEQAKEERRRQEAKAEAEAEAKIKAEAEARAKATI